jgi:hypothetical protein
MNKPRLVKRAEINRQQTPPTSARPPLAQLKKAVQEKKQPAPQASAQARVAFAALFAAV